MLTTARYLVLGVLLAGSLTARIVFASARLELSPSNVSYILGEPVVAKVDLMNESTGPLALDLRTLDDPSLVKIWVLDKDRATTYVVHPELEPGAKRETFMLPAGERYAVRRLLQPGLREEAGRAGAPVFLFGHPGQYSIWATAPKSLGGPEQQSALRSNTVTVSVRPVPPDLMDAYGILISEKEEAGFGIDLDRIRQTLPDAVTAAKLNALVRGGLGPNDEEARKHFEHLFRESQRSTYGLWARFFVAGYYLQKPNLRSQRMAASHYRILLRLSPSFPLKEKHYQNLAIALSALRDDRTLSSIMQRYLEETKGFHTRLSIAFRKRLEEMSSP